jgi:hypothetical protein
MMDQRLVRVAQARRGEVIGVHGRRGKPGHGVDQGMLGRHRQLVRLHHGQLRVDDDVGLGALWMVSPSSATDPDSATITACTTAVAPSVASEIRNTRP